MPNSYKESYSYKWFRKHYKSKFESSMFFAFQAKFDEDAKYWSFEVSSDKYKVAYSHKKDFYMVFVKRSEPNSKWQKVASCKCWQSAFRMADHSNRNHDRY